MKPIISGKHFSIENLGTLCQGRIHIYVIDIVKERS